MQKMFYKMPDVFSFFCLRNDGYNKIKPVTSTQRICRRTHPKIPFSRNSFLRNVQYVRENGAMELHSRSERPSMTSQNDRSLFNYFRRHPRTFLRTAEIRLGLPRRFIHRVHWKRLHLFPYILHIVQKVEECDYESSIEFSNWGIENIGLGTFFLNSVFSDECVFHVDGKVNKQNVMICGSKNSYKTREVSQDIEKVTVWCVLVSDHLNGQLYFDK